MEVFNHVMGLKNFTEYFSRYPNYTFHGAQCVLLSLRALCVLKMAGVDGSLRFGSLGWARRDGNGVHYEFGGEDWTMRQFLRGSRFITGWDLTEFEPRQKKTVVKKNVETVVVHPKLADFLLKLVNFDTGDYRFPTHLSPRLLPGSHGPASTLSALLSR